MCNMFQDYNLGENFQCRNPGERRDIFEEASELYVSQTVVH